MRSSIFLDRVRLRAFHGVMPQERRVGGDFLVSLKVDYDFSRALDTDDVADTLSYADLLDVVQREMAVPSRLLEHVAGRIARTVVSAYPATASVWVRIVKVNPPMGADCEGAGVELHLINDKTQG